MLLTLRTVMGIEYQYVIKFAERKGFEPPVPFWSTHAFQACLLNHSSISPSFWDCKCIKRNRNMKILSGIESE